MLKKSVGVLYLIAAFALAGTSVVTARQLDGRIGNFTLMAVSLLFALALLLPLCGRKRLARLRHMPLPLLGRAFQQAFFGIFLFRVLLLYSLKYTSAAEAGLLTGATPAITALLAGMMLREKLRGRKALGILCSVAGISLMQGAASVQQGMDPAHWQGNLLALGAAGSEAVFNVLSRRGYLNSLSEKTQQEPMLQTTLVIAIAFLMSAVPAMLEHPFAQLKGIGVVEWISVLWYGLVVTALGFIFLYAGIRRCGAMWAAAVSGVMPFTAMLLSVLVLGERIGWQQALGGFMVIAGIAMLGGNAEQRITVAERTTQSGEEGLS